MSASSTHFEAFHLATSDGFRFCALHRPRTLVPSRGQVLFVHPFAEEMNRARRTVALGARALAEDGWTVLQIDLRGCGDSSGEFGDATWEDWRADVRLAANRVRQEGTGDFWLWGLRSGALLLPAALDDLPSAHLLLWQPVTSGRTVLTNFLRLKAAAGLVGGNGGETALKVRQQLSADGSIEIAGYRLSERLAAGLEIARLELPVGFTGRTVWLEVAAAEGAALSVPARKSLDAWRAQGLSASAETVVGPPFWQTIEIAECRALVERSRALLGRR